MKGLPMCMFYSWRYFTKHVSDLGWVDLVLRVPVAGGLLLQLSSAQAEWWNIQNPLGLRVI